MTGPADRGARTRGGGRLAALIVLASMASSLMAPASASAQSDGDRLTWSSDWSRVHPVSYGVAGLGVGFSLLFDGVYEGGTEALFRGPMLFDEPVRDALMAPSAEGRHIAARVSDVLLGALVAWPLLDAVIVAGIEDTNADVFGQLTSIVIQSYAIELLLNTLFKKLIARERPHGFRCTLEDRRVDPGRCGSEGRTRSFYSGHSSFAFSAAGLVCVNHAHVPLYDSDVADGIACGTALLVATTVATLRMVADRHYITDTFVGAVMGLASGFLVPFLLQYQNDPTPEPAADPTAAPIRAPIVSGLGGTF